MKVRTWDWNAQRFVEADYPDVVFVEFIDFLMNTKRWREDPDLLYDRTKQLERQLGDFRALTERQRQDLLTFEEQARFNGETVKWDNLMTHVRTRERERKERAARLEANRAKHAAAKAALELNGNATTVIDPPEPGPHLGELITEE